MAWRHHQKDQPRREPDIRERSDPITLSCLEKTILLAALELYRTHPQVRGDADVDALCQRFEHLAAFPGELPGTRQYKVRD
jgi:hypothetical protein